MINHLNKYLLTLAFFSIVGVNVAHAEYHDEFSTKVENIQERISDYESQMANTHFNSPAEREGKEHEFLNSVNAMARDINGAHNRDGETGSTLQFRNIADAKNWLKRIDSSTSAIPARDADNSSHNNPGDSSRDDNTADSLSQAETYADEAANEAEHNANNHANTAAIIATATAEGYTDTVVEQAKDEVKSYTDGVAKTEASAAEDRANTYADNLAKNEGAVAEARAKSFTEETAGKTLDASEAYAEERAETAKTQANQHTDIQAQASKKYTDVQRKAADLHADQVSKQATNTAARYTDSRVAQGVEYSTNYTNRVATKTSAAAIKTANNYTDHVAKGLKNQINRNKRAIKRMGASSQATANLHYNGNKNGYAVALGQYSDETSLAGGLQFKVSAHNAITAQVSYDAEHMGGSIGLHGDW